MRRVLLLLVLLGAAGFVAMRLRVQAATTAAGDPPTWPPITRRPDPTPVATTVTERTAVAEHTAVAERPIDASSPAAIAVAVPWKPLNDDGTMPDGYPIKAKNQSMIFHVPGGRFYDRTRPERCYATEDAAVADGFRRSKT